MKRDRTVIPAAFICVAMFTALSFFSDANDIESGLIQALYVIILLIGIIALFRVGVLFYQTLSHAIWSPWVSNRAIWIGGHLLFGPLASVPYYLRHKSDRLLTKDKHHIQSKSFPGLKPEKKEVEQGGVE